MEVEVEGEDGSKFSFGNDEETVFGRGCGFNTDDRTVSRRHVSFKLDHSDPEVANARVSFQVIGKNPFWVFDGEALRFFRKLEKGHLQLGHRFSFSANTPLWFTLNNIQHHPQLDLDAINVKEIDPVKEFGFVMMGHEFDKYPKGMIRDVKNWEWFLEKPGKEDSEDEEDSENERRKMKRKRKMGKVNEDDDDDEWSGDSEDDKDLVVANVRKGKLPRYSTRLKETKGGMKGGKNKNSKQKKVVCVDETVEEDDDDETLGGFIVADEDDDRQEENDDEEEEFEDDDDEVDG